jgi:ABC-2 type transport system ATP-binding protein
MLDEPTLGLDPNQIRHIRHLIKGLGGRHTVLLSSHILSEVQMICERVLIMNAGRIVAADRTENLTALANGAATVSLEVQGASEAVRAALQGVPGVLRVAAQESQGWCRAICECEPARDLRADLFEVVVSNGWRLRELKAERRNLEEVFVEITRESAGGSAGAGAAPAGAAEEARP